ncbi:hypothetical protein BT67DRAFT_145388 [Trichocladium antarcticum]|uniref:Uncharacterized protein n=1 Tax=Trichocladium antarcticum TaxID=1450529 RepID=A0AAN6ZA97_9PEZI|nr:hypothetical protein BT67DRAFT_145388 [Trichocladium antarcticum]
MLLNHFMCPAALPLGLLNLRCIHHVPVQRHTWPCSRGIGSCALSHPGGRAPVAGIQPPTPPSSPPTSPNGSKQASTRRRQAWQGRDNPLPQISRNDRFHTLSDQWPLSCVESERKPHTAGRRRPDALFRSQYP